MIKNLVMTNNAFEINDQRFILSRISRQSNSRTMSFDKLSIKI